MKLMLTFLLVASCIYATYAACSGAEDCFTCLRRETTNDDFCGWCADDLECYAGDASGPGGFASNCTDSWFYDTCSGGGADCASDDGDCDTCLSNPLCAYCHGDNTCVEVQDDSKECNTDDFSTFNCGVQGLRCDAGEVDNDGECVDCPPFGNQSSQEGNACNYNGKCKPSGSSARCDCKNGFAGASCQYVVGQQTDLGTLDQATVADSGTSTLSNPGLDEQAVTQVSVTNNSGASVECSLLSLETDSDGDVADQAGYAAVSLAEDDGVGEPISGNTGFDLSCVNDDNEEVDIDDLDVTATIDAGEFGLTCDEIDIAKYDTDENEWVSIREECGAPTGSTTCVFSICHFSQFAVVQAAGTTTTASSTSFSFSSFSTSSFSFSSSSSSSSGASAVRPALLLAALALFGALFTF